MPLGSHLPNSTPPPNFCITCFVFRGGVDQFRNFACWVVHPFAPGHFPGSGRKTNQKSSSLLAGGARTQSEQLPSPEVEMREFLQALKDPRPAQPAEPERAERARASLAR